MVGTIQDYTLDMAADTKSEPLRVKQCDTNSRQAKITLKMGHELWTIPFDAQIYLNVMKTDGNLATSTCTKVDEHTVLAPVTKQMTAISGTHMAELYFLGGDGDIKTQSFKLVVYPMVMDQDQIESSRDFQSLQDALRDVKASTEAADTSAQYATEQGNAARDAAQRAEDAADSLQIAVDAAKAAKASETNAKASETAAAQTQQEVTDYVESQKAAFVGYSKRETDSQYANAIIKTATGAGRVDVDDAWTAPVIGLDVAGKSEQVVTTGKNLFGGNALAETIKVKAGANVDGVNGTVTFVAANIDGKEIYSDFETGKEYTIVLYGRNTNAEIPSKFANLKVNYNDGTTDGLAYEKANQDSYCIFHTTQGKNITSISGTWASAGTLLYYDKCGIFEGNIDLSAFEPYTGAAASPSPAYPQQIVSTGTVGTGAQLLDLRAGKSGTGDGVTYTSNGDGTFKRSGTATGAVGNAWLWGYYMIAPAEDNSNVLLTLEAGKTYTIKDCVLFSVEAGGPLSAPEGKITIDAATYPEGFKVTGVRNPGQASGTAYNDTIYPMVCEGPYAKPWEPYTGGKPAPSAEYPQLLNIYSAVGGRNLIPKANISPVGCNSVILDSTMEVRFGYTSVWSGTGIILGTFPAGTYTINYLDSTDTYRMISSVVIGDIIKNRNETYAQSNYVGGGGYMGKIKTPYSFELKSEAKIGLIVAKAENETDRSGTIKNLKLEKGELATPWVPAPEDITPENAEQYSDLIRTATITLTEPLRGIGEYRDRLGYRDGVWGIERRYAEVVYDGSADEAWVEYEKKGSIALLIIAISDCLSGFQTSKCDRYSNENSTWVDMYDGRYGVYSDHVSNQVKYFRFPNAEVTTLAQWRAWLAANPLTLVYQRATPTWTPLPDATQQALNALTTFAGTTHLTITTGGTTPDVTLDYVQDTHKALEEHDAAAKEYTDNQLANIVAAMPVEVQAAIVDTQITTLLKEV